MQLKISVIVLTLNEAVGIAATLSHLRAFDDVIVVDSGSTDGTTRIAKSAGARVVKFAWNGEYPKKKQWSLENSGAQHDWVLLLDADEYPSADLIAELSALTTHDVDDFGAFDILLRYRFAGRFLRHGHRVVKRSLLDRRRASFPLVNDLVPNGLGEVEGHYQPETALKVGKLRGRIMHDDRDPVTSWFSRHNKYSDWEALLRQDDLTRRQVAAKRSLQGRIFDRVPFKPFLFFVYGYIARAGFLDGRAGFDYHLALSVYYWQISLKSRLLRANQVSSNSD